MKNRYKNIEWVSFSKKIIQRDGNKCTKCNRSNTVLQAHHLRYRSGLKVWEYPQSDCITLCKGCHAEEHGIIEPKNGWILISINDNEDCSYCCERDGCGVPIRYEHEVYHPISGYKIVGSHCVDFMTDESKKISECVLNVNKSLGKFLYESKWIVSQTKNGTKYMSCYYRKCHELRIYGNPPFASLQVAKKEVGKRKWDYSNFIKAQGKTMDQCKELLYLIARGWTSKDEEERETIRRIYKQFSKQ